MAGRVVGCFPEARGTVTVEATPRTFQEDTQWR